MKVSIQWVAVAIVLCFASGANAAFTLFASETPAGSLGSNTSAYGALEQYSISSSGGTATAGPGLPSSTLHDPSGLSFYNGHLFIANRHGNTLGLGSVQRADWDGSTLSNVTTVATQASPSDQGFHGIGFGPDGDLYITTVNNGTHRFRDSGSGYAQIAATSNGAVRDAWITPDGSKLFETTTGNAILVTQLTGSGFGGTTSFAVNGASAMHQMTMMGGSLYVTGFNSGTVHKITLDGSFNPVSSTTVANSTGAIGIAFSPDAQEMYVSRHSIGDIERFSLSGSNWTSTGFILTGKSMGYLAVPEPGVMLGWCAGLCSLLLFRRKARR